MATGGRDNSIEMNDLGTGDYHREDFDEFMDPNQMKYAYSPHDPASKLEFHELANVLLLPSRLKGDWAVLASHLGYSASDIELLRRSHNPAKDMLEEWSRKRGSTILRLKIAIEALGREDVLDKFLECLEGKFQLCLTIESSGDSQLHNDTVLVSGRYSLGDTLRTKLARRDIKLEDIVFRDPTPGVRDPWKASAQRFKNEHLMFRRRNDLSKKAQTKGLGFNVPTQCTDPGTPHHVNSTMRMNNIDDNSTVSTSSTTPKMTNIPPNLQTPPAFGGPVPSAPTGRSPTENRAGTFETAMENDTYEKDSEDFSSIKRHPAWHPTMPNSAREIHRAMKPLLKKDGCFLVRPFVEGKVNMVVSVIHLNDIRHFQIKEAGEGPEKVFYFYRNEFRARSPAELIEYYREHSLSRNDDRRLSSSSDNQLPDSTTEDDEGAVGGEPAADARGPVLPPRNGHIHLRFAVTPQALEGAKASNC